MRTLIAFFLAVTAIAALSSFATLRWMESHDGAGVDSHDWLHAKLGLTSQEREALAPIEAAYLEWERPRLERLQEANRELASLIREGRLDSPETAATVAEIHNLMGEMQAESIEHVSRMLTVLTPEQRERMLQLAAEGLEASP